MNKRKHNINIQSCGRIKINEGNSTQPIKHLKVHSNAHDREKLLFLFVYVSITRLQLRLGLGR